MNKLKNLGAGFIVGKILKGMAAGKYGKLAAYLYWHLKGIKTALGVALGVLAGFIAVLDHYGVCAIALQHWAWFDCAAWTGAVVKVTASVAAFFVWIGQVDGGLHLEAPDRFWDDPQNRFNLPYAERR